MPDENTVTWEYLSEPEGGLRLRLQGHLTLATIGACWLPMLRQLQAAPPVRLRIEAAALTRCDSAGLKLLATLCEAQLRGGRQWEVRGLPQEYQRLFELIKPGNPAAPVLHEEHAGGLAEEVGRQAVGLIQGWQAQIAFIGEFACAIGSMLARRSRLRWRDVWIVMEEAGVNALPIIGLIGLLLGLILAFQSAIPLKRFGAEIFVANLVALSLVRELGPLLTAIILSARSGSAFAAELGTMKVNEEIDALTTMGLNPVRFLVVTRVLAAVLVTPLLVVFANLFGLIGAAVVMLAMGFPLVTFINQVVAFVTIGDFMGGLFKSLIFALLVASAGCLSGLRAGSGASAVGQATTGAVVSGILLIVITDGLFAVLFYYLGI